ncbi:MULTISPECIES: nicotinate (nicotinamide) nucleotide adenylyltransferase [unclassified Helicobacter]|uniref:nicotinate (nicotinamide) nucleotide adenylyltransferase n=1 Tax=unclassified Helicobacter TaxID=2593540 RepID=UPI000CF17437|nr:MULTISPECIES: nicotinate (nicotinamide) nucleotide adenylyltransferase [unclassified Helicobacter]
MRLALYGGSFDPPHIAHIQIIKEASKKLKVDLLIVMVAYQNPFKQKSTFGNNLRLEWMKKSCLGINKVFVSDFEIKQKIKYTIDTINFLEKKYSPQSIDLILGEDNLLTLPQWRDFNILKNKVNFVFVRRSGFDYNIRKINGLQLELENINFPISSTMIKQDFNALSQDVIPKEIASEVFSKLKEQRMKQERLDFIIQKLSDKKAEAIECIDVRDKDYIVDYVIIATAMVGRHTYALLDMLKTELKPRGENFYAVDEESEDWIVVDLGDIMIHLFTQNHRNKFNLEEFLLKDLQKQM